MSAQELESAVARLAPDELARFAEWFEAYRADDWDRQIGKDLDLDRLDALLADVDAEIEREGTRPL